MCVRGLERGVSVCEKVGERSKLAEVSNDRGKTKWGEARKEARVE